MKDLFPNGHILLSSPTTCYDVTYCINKWMHPERNNVDKTKAAKQWQVLRNLISRLGAFTEILSIPHPDGVFSANAGLVYKDRFILSSFKHPERQTEESYWMNWAKTVRHPDNPGKRLFDSVHFLNNWSFEGAGDALFVGDLLCCGHGFRTEQSAIIQIAHLLQVDVISLKLTNPRFYHLDTCFCPLSKTEVLYYPGAFGEKTVETIQQKFDAIEVGQADAQYFACNSVVLGKDVIIPRHCENTMAKLRSRGYTCYPVDMSEYLKSGGACKCLTLRYY